MKWTSIVSNTLAGTLPFLNLDNNKFEIAAKDIDVPEEFDMNEMWVPTKYNQTNK